MGQYYDVYVSQNNVEKHYNKSVLPDCEYMMAKLTEHSWWENPFCRALAYSIIDKPTKVAWVGDYAEPEECDDEVVRKINGDYDDDGRQIYDEFIEDEPINPAPNTFRMEDYYLVNSTQKLYMSLKDYKERNQIIQFVESTMDDELDNGWCLFPISLLTAVGNGKGGGDYIGCNLSDIGSWTLDLMYLTKDISKIEHEYKRVVYEFID